jgi:hypothetical protein
MAISHSAVPSSGAKPSASAAPSDGVDLEAM